MKTAWALGAAFVAVVLVLVVFSVMATEIGSAERLASSETFDGIEVPTIGTVGDFPDPAHRHVVSVMSDGRIVVQGRTPATYGELVGLLRELASRSSGEPIPGTNKHLSGESFVIRADAASAFGHAFQAVAACAEAMADRIFFAVRHEGDGADGALALWLPMDKGCESGPDRYTTSIVLVPAPIATGAGAGWLQITSSPFTATGRMDVSIDAPDEASLGDLLRWIDAVRRGGANFEGFPLRSCPKLGDPIPTPITVAPALSAKWTGSRFLPGTARDLATAPVGAMPPVARVRGAFAGTYH